MCYMALNETTNRTPDDWYAISFFLVSGTSANIAYF